MRKIFNVVLLLVLVALIGFTLRQNKQEIDEETRLAERKVSTWPVVIEKVKKEKLQSTIRIAASLQPEKELRMVSQTQGAVIKIYKEQGDQVKKGQVLVKVNDELFRAETLVAEANHNQAQKDLARFEKLSSGDAVTAQQLEQIQLKAKAAEAKFITAQKRLNDTSIKAPYSGVINRFFVVEGSMLSGGVPVCELVNIETLKMTAKLSESEVLTVSKGNEVQVKVDAHPLKTYTGKITHISVKADPSLLYDVEILIPNDNEVLKAGMFGEALFSSETEFAVTTISRKALVENTAQSAVYVVSGDEVRVKPVVLGRNSGSRVEILEGLTENEQVVVSGQLNLFDGARVKVMEPSTPLSQ